MLKNIFIPCFFFFLFKNVVHLFCKATTTDYHGTERTLDPVSSGTEKLESKYHRAVLLPKALGQDASSPLPAPGGSKCSSVCGCITPVSAYNFTSPSFLCVCLCLRYPSPFPYVDTSHWTEDPP